MQNTTDSDADVDPISPAALEYDDAGSSERTSSFVCAGVLILVVLPCAWYARRVKRNSPIAVPAGATALTRLEVIRLSVSKETSAAVLTYHIHRIYRPPRSCPLLFSITCRDSSMGDSLFSPTVAFLWQSTIDLTVKSNLHSTTKLCWFVPFKV